VKHQYPRRRLPKEETKKLSKRQQFSVRICIVTTSSSVLLPEVSIPSLDKMMKSWADHCSSDEESVDDVQDDFQNQTLDDPPQVIEAHQQLPDAIGEEGAGGEHPEEPHGDDAAPPAPQERVYDFPDKPPFTAFVGNLAYTIKEGEDLKQAIADVAHERLGAKINVIGGRIGVDRRDGRHRGFGYVEVETLDEVRVSIRSF
jgi:hypothetical protein